MTLTSRTITTGLLYGGLVGAVLGAVGRPLVLFLFFHNQLADLDSAILLEVIFVSATIGGAIGLISGLIAALIPILVLGPVVGAILGGVTAYFVTIFGALLLAILFCLGPNPRQRDLFRDPFDPNGYLGVMTFTGVLSGAAGGIVGHLLRMRKERAIFQAEEIGDEV